jgi:hypothetical protein
VSSTTQLSKVSALAKLLGLLFQQITASLIQFNAALSRKDKMFESDKHNLRPTYPGKILEQMLIKQLETGSHKISNGSSVSGLKICLHHCTNSMFSKEIKGTLGIINWLVLLMNLVTIPLTVLPVRCLARQV